MSATIRLYCKDPALLADLTSDLRAFIAESYPTDGVSLEIADFLKPAVGATPAAPPSNDARYILACLQELGQATARALRDHAEGAGRPLAVSDAALSSKLRYLATRYEPPLVQEVERRVTRESRGRPSIVWACTPAGVAQAALAR